MGTERSMRVLRRNSIPEWMRAGVPKKAWLKFPLRLYGWAHNQECSRTIVSTIVHRHSLLIPGTFVRRGLERQKYINSSLSAQCGELGARNL